MTVKTQTAFFLLFLLCACGNSGRSSVDQDTTLPPKDLRLVEDQSDSDTLPRDSQSELTEDVQIPDIVILDLKEVSEVTEDLQGDTLPEWCCANQDDCPDAMVCGPGHSCIPPLQPGQCFEDEDCYMIQTCVGATVCPCDKLCAAPTTPGHCDPLPLSCCYTDSDCAEGMLCRGEGSVDSMPGSCVPPPNSEVCPFDAQCCWNDTDCGGDSTCFEAFVCGCIDLCPVCGQCMPDSPGWCG